MRRSTILFFLCFSNQSGSLQIDPPPCPLPWPQRKNYEGNDDDGGYDNDNDDDDDINYAGSSGNKQSWQSAPNH